LNCKHVIREISNYIDGELDPALKQELERHLQHCEDCTMIVDQTRRTIKIYSGSVPVDLPSDVKSRLHAAIHKKLPPRSV
jgi:anti-sigma factor RsiW